MTVMTKPDCADASRSDERTSANAVRKSTRKNGQPGQSFPDKTNLVRFTGVERGEGLRVLHIVPFVYFDEEYRFLGSTKDIDGRQQYLKQSGAPFDTFVHLKNHRRLHDELSFFILPEYTHIIVDLSKTPEELAYLKHRWPSAKLIVRSHNPELAHRLDYIRATRRIRSTPQERRSTLYNLGVFYERERGVAKYADAILHIETPNTAWYWRALGFRGDVYTAPYFTSDYYLERTPPERPRRRRRPQIVCLGSSHPGPLIGEMMVNYHRMTAELGARFEDFEFLATGELPASIREGDVSPRVRRLGFVDDILTLLSESFAVAVTSDLGRGFKTKILEAITCGAWVIVSPGLMKRMPDALRPYCAALDRRYSSDGLVEAIDDLSSRRWPAGDPNSILREDSYSALDAAIFGEPARKRRFAGDRPVANLTARSVQ